MKISCHMALTSGSSPASATGWGEPGIDRHDAQMHTTDEEAETPATVRATAAHRVASDAEGVGPTRRMPVTDYRPHSRLCGLVMVEAHSTWTDMAPPPSRRSAGPGPAGVDSLAP